MSEFHRHRRFPGRCHNESCGRELTRRVRHEPSPLTFRIRRRRWTKGQPGWTKGQLGWTKGNLVFRKWRIIAHTLGGRPKREDLVRNTNRSTGEGRKIMSGRTLVSLSASMIVGIACVVTVATDAFAYRRGGAAVTRGGVHHAGVARAGVYRGGVAVPPPCRRLSRWRLWWCTRSSCSGGGPGCCCRRCCCDRSIWCIWPILRSRQLLLRLRL